MNAVHKFNGLFVLNPQAERIIRYIRITLKTPSNTPFSLLKKQFYYKNELFLKKNAETFGTYQNNAYLCIAIQK